MRSAKSTTISLHLFQTCKFSRYKCIFNSQNLSPSITCWSIITDSLLFLFLTIKVRITEILKIRTCWWINRNKLLHSPLQIYLIVIFCDCNIMTQINICNMSIKMYFKSRIFLNWLETNKFRQHYKTFAIMMEPAYKECTLRAHYTIDF